ncbi:MAG: transposase [Spirochaetaceae bacterium]|jgi:REP element-mobilizing transposase RayT|nr:transposase [Spirochaetaceae bacterium]
MRMSRILEPDVWYKIFTAVNRHEPIFLDRDAVDLFNRTLLETGERFPCEVRSLVIRADSVSFYIKPADGLQLPEIMQWLKQTYAVRYNVMKHLEGHLWEDRYWSKVLEGEPPEEESAAGEAGRGDCAGSDGEGSAVREIAGGEIPTTRLERGPPDGDSLREGETAENTGLPPDLPRSTVP